MITSAPSNLVIGKGYVNLPLAPSAVPAMFDIVRFPVDEAKIAGLTAGRTNIDDIADADADAAGALATVHYPPNTVKHEMADFDIAVTALLTPLSEGVPDTSYIESARQTVLGPMHQGCRVVLKSTTWQSATEQPLVPILQVGTGLVTGFDFNLDDRPERIDRGNATWPFQVTPMVVSGVGAASSAAMEGFCDRPGTSPCPRVPLVRRR